MKTDRFECNEDLSQRLNIMKLLCMVMVLYIHAEALPNLPYEPVVPGYVTACRNMIVNGLCAIAVPGFFLISGFLLYRKEFTWKENLKKKVKSILIPYLLINTFWVLFFKGMQSMEFTKALFQGYGIEGIRGLLGAYLDPMPVYYPFWFLRELFILNLIAKPVKWIIDKLPLLSLLMILALSVPVIHLPLLLYNDSFCAFALSYYLVKYLRPETADRVNGWIPAVLWGLLLIAKLENIRYRYWKPVFWIAGIWFLYRLAGKMRTGKAAKALLWCSRFSFCIYAFHEFYESMLKKILMLLLPQYGIVQLLEFILLPLPIMAGCISAGAFLKQKLPRFYEILCGNR